MKVITEATDDVVSTEDNPIIASGLNVALRCHKCDNVFALSEAGKWIPGGHGKWCAYKCPECDARVAREKGSNRYIDEDYVDQKVADAFEGKFGEDPARLRKPSAVDATELGDTVDEVIVYYPGKGQFDRLPVVDGDADDGEAYVERREDDVDTSWYHDDVDACIVCPNGTKKPVGYPAEWDKDDEDIPKGRANREVWRFVEAE